MFVTKEGIDHVSTVASAYAFIVDVFHILIRFFLKVAFCRFGSMWERETKLIR